MTTASGGAVEEESRRKRGGGRGGETNDRPNVRRLVSQAFGGVFGVVFCWRVGENMGWGGANGVLDSCVYLTKKQKKKKKEKVSSL
jgi:hypothetical protein